MDTIGYIYEAAVHCESCTLERFPDLTGVDREGNEISPYTDDDGANSNSDTCCDDCGELLYEMVIEVVKAIPGDKSRQGIHLLNPSDEEIEQAKDQAKNECFTVVYVHTDKTWNYVPPLTANQRRSQFKLIQGGAA